MIDSTVVHVMALVGLVSLGYLYLDCSKKVILLRELLRASPNLPKSSLKTKVGWPLEILRSTAAAVGVRVNFGNGKLSSGKPQKLDLCSLNSFFSLATVKSIDYDHTSNSILVVVEEADGKNKLLMTELLDSFIGGTLRIEIRHS